MQKGWLRLLIVIGMLLVATGESRADGWLSFVNTSPSNGRQYVYQITGEKVGPPYMAQLYLMKEDWVAVSQPVKFLSSGLFFGGPLAISGDYGGITVTLQVRVWDGDRYASYQEALDGLSNCGASAPFSVTLGTSSSQPAPMATFQSFRLYWDDSGTLIPSAITSELVIAEGESVHMDYPSYSLWDLTGIVGYCKNPIKPIPGYLPGLSLGTLHGVVYPNPYGHGPQELNPYTYTPNPHTYGTDLIYYPTGATPNSEGPTRSGAIAITIQPSAARSGPTLLLAAPMKPVLLGLNTRQYRIDRSLDLKTWEPAGTVSGNYSTVDLSSFVTAGANTHFLRATDVTTP